MGGVGDGEDVSTNFQLPIIPLFPLRATPAFNITHMMNINVEGISRVAGTYKRDIFFGGKKTALFFIASPH